MRSVNEGGAGESSDLRSRLRTDARRRLQRLEPAVLGRTLAASGLKFRPCDVDGLVLCVMDDTRPDGSARRRVAVVSPFVDRQHGTERRVAEVIDRLVRDHGWEVHLYSERMDGLHPHVVWHRVAAAPGPYLVRYLWWFLANHLWRWWDRRVRGLRFDVTYSSGVNCLDAQVVTVHIVFAVFYRRVRHELRLLGHPARTWPRLVHRHLYYWLIAALERLVYTRRRVRLAAISRKTAGDVARLYGRGVDVAVVYHGIDSAQFNPEARGRLRPGARAALGLADTDFAMLLVGNDWKTKGLRCLLEAVARLGEPGVRVLVAGHDDLNLFRDLVAGLGLEGKILFLPPRPDVESYYAAADCYVGPSLEDAFALPVAEAMASGLPVIVSSQAGASEIVTDGVDALVLKDPRDPGELAALVRLVYEDGELRARLAAHAPQTARAYTWERNAAALDAVFREQLGR